MIFHIHHRHDENTCPANSPETLGATFGSVLPSLAEHGVTVIGAWVDPPGHDFFFVVETDSYDDLVEGFRPILSAGTAKIQPVGDVQAQVAKRMAEAN